MYQWYVYRVYRVLCTKYRVYRAACTKYQVLHVPSNMYPN